MTSSCHSTKEQGSTRTLNAGVEKVEREGKAGECPRALQAHTSVSSPTTPTGPIGHQRPPENTLRHRVDRTSREQTVYVFFRVAYKYTERITYLDADIASKL